jgi:hypothetical protein
MNFLVDGDRRYLPFENGYFIQEPQSTKTYTEVLDEQTKRTKREKKIRTARQTGLKIRRGLSYTIITKIPVFDCAVALCTIQNALLVIRNST